MCPNRLDIEYSYRKGFPFLVFLLLLLGGFVRALFWFFFLLVLGFFPFVFMFDFLFLLFVEGFFCDAGFISMHQFSVSSFHFTQQRVSGVANRVCNCKTTFSIGNYNKIANMSFVSGSKS